MTSFIRDEGGNVAIIFSIMVPVLFGAAALTITHTDSQNVRNKVQASMDTAVLAAASAPYELSEEERIAVAKTYYGGNSTSRAKGAATFDVTKFGSANFIVTPTAVYGKLDFKMASPFLGIFHRDSLDVHVESAAKRGSGPSACVIGLDQTEEETIDFNGKASLQIDKCAAQANSSSGNGLSQKGTPSMVAEAIGVTGGFSGAAYTPPPVTGTDPIPDPMASLPQPQSGPCHPMSGYKLQQTQTKLSPGTYCGGLTIKASSVVTLEPGIYIFKNGPLLIDSQSQVSGEQVMLAFLGPSSTLYLYSGASLNVTSPTSGPYTNVQFFGDRNVYAGPGSNGAFGSHLWFTVIGDSRLTFDGILYAPKFHIWLAGGSIVTGQSPNYIAVAKKLWFQDNTQVHFKQDNSRGLDVPKAANLSYGSVLIN